MDEVIEVSTEIELSTPLRFAKMICAATAGFMASEAAKRAFDKIVEARRNATTSV